MVAANLPSEPLVLHDQYALTNIIGRSATALSGLARDRTNGQPVFVKAKTTDQGRECLVREADALNDLVHPQIPQLVRTHFDRDVPVLVTEAVPGNRYVAEWLKKYPFPKLAANLVCSALDPLEYMHDAGMLHRDIKTANLVMQMSGHTALVDFELILREDTPDFQVGDIVTGTAQYMSPERVMGDSGDPASDVYSMGIVLYELLYGVLPFPGEDSRAVALRHCREPIQFYGNGRRPVPEDLIEVIDRATQKDPDERYQSAGEMHDDLAIYLRG